MSAYEEYNGPTCWADCSPDELRAAIEDGILCSECGSEFSKEHGHKTACAYCFRRMTAAEIAAEGVRLATHEEVNKAAHAAEGRKRKATKQRREQSK